MTTKIAINGTYIQEQASGLGVVTSNLIDRLIEQPSHEASSFDGELVGGDNKQLDFLLYSHADRLQTQYPKSFLPVSSSLSPDRGFPGHIRRLLWYQTTLNWQLKRNNIDLFFSPATEGMLFPSISQIITVHDLIPLKYPQVSPKWRYYYLYILPLMLKQSYKVISISEHTKKDLVETYNLNPESIEVVYNGYDGDLFSPQPNPEILTKYNLDKYFLYVGDMRTYKNLDRCLSAFERLSFSDHKFVITGRKDDFFYPQLKSKVDLLSCKERIIFLDYVADEDLPSLYSMAQCLVFVSLYEGFGLPVLEAMACGCPVLTCDRTSIPEVGGDSVLYVDPEDVESIAQGMYEMIANTNLRENLINLGLERAKQFSWNKTADGVRRIFAEAIDIA